MLQQSGREKFFEQVAAERKATYEPILRQLGMSDDQIRTNLERLAQLHSHAIAAGDSTLSMIEARRDYDRRMKSELGDQRYAEYISFEQSKPYRREVEEIGAFAATKGVVLDATVKHLMASMLQESGIQTSETWDGPYDPAPRPAVGREEVSMRMEEFASRIANGLESFKAAADQRMSPELVALSIQYLNAKMEEIRRAQEIASMSVAERRRLADEQERQFRKTKP